MKKMKAETWLYNAGFEKGMCLVPKRKGVDAIYLWMFKGLKIAVATKAKWTLQDFVLRIADQAASTTRKKIKYKMEQIDLGVNGYVE